MKDIEAENRRLREALAKIIAVPTGYHAAAKMEGIARAALSPVTNGNRNSKTPGQQINSIPLEIDDTVPLTNGDRN